MSGTLFVAATPIGNLGDMTARFAETLATCDLVLAEDTRRSQKLLAHVGVRVPLQSLHEHNERERTDGIVSLLEEGKTIMLITDAGTPAVSDPGQWLVRLASEAGIPVVPLPGASALSAALSVCGLLPTPDGVWFVGFLATKKSVRTQQVADIDAFSGWVVLFEAPHRIESLVADLASSMPTREICLCRELTKLHEEIRRVPLKDAPALVNNTAQGEYTLVLGPRSDETQSVVRPNDARLIEGVRLAQDAGLSHKDAAALVAKLVDVPKRDVYQLTRK